MEYCTQTSQCTVNLEVHREVRAERIKRSGEAEKCENEMHWALHKTHSRSPGDASTSVHQHHRIRSTRTLRGSDSLSFVSKRGSQYRNLHSRNTRNKIIYSYDKI